ncbi:MAG: response regulator [Chthoniobacterales bacterium]
MDAIQACTRLQPDLVLLDYSLPRLNGATAARMILAKDPAARIVIISAVPPAAQLAESGAIAILSKPVELDKLYAAFYDAAPPPNEPREEFILKLRPRIG